MLEISKSGYTIKLKSRLYDLSSPIVMGIINLTPDSFFSLSRYKSDSHLLKRIENFIEEGATIIDVGGYSTRPQAEAISVDEEMARVSKALNVILKNFPELIISVDTFRSRVARMAVEDYDVAMINDISGGILDPVMFETIAQYSCLRIDAHKRGASIHAREHRL